MFLVADGRSNPVDQVEALHELLPMRPDLRLARVIFVADAARAIGCTQAQIAKSLVFRAKKSGRAVLVITSGRNRVDDKKIRALLGEKIERASAEFVKEMTGFEVGGVPPVAHDHPCTVFIDQDLQAFPTVWAAGGTGNAVFEIGFDELVTASGAMVRDVKKN